MCALNIFGECAGLPRIIQLCTIGVMSANVFFGPQVKNKKMIVYSVVFKLLTPVVSVHVTNTLNAVHLLVHPIIVRVGVTLGTYYFTVMQVFMYRSNK